MSNFIIKSYPRSGSTFLDFYLQLRFDRSVARDHVYKKKKEYEVLGIFRDPIDSITSCISMQEYYYEDYEVNGSSIIKEINEYVEASQFLIDKAAMVIDCKSLFENPEMVIKKVSDKFNIEVVSEEQYQTTLTENKDWSFLPSSKDLPRYLEIRDMVSEYDLSACYEVYGRLIEISVD